MREVRVDLPGNGYDILIGTGIEEAVVSFFTGADFSSRVLVIYDTKVGKV